MAVIVLRRLEDFKTLVRNAGLIVFWQMDPQGDLLLYASAESVYSIRLTVNEPENLMIWLESNFERLMELRDLIE